MYIYIYIYIYIYYNSVLYANVDYGDIAHCFRETGCFRLKR